MNSGTAHGKRPRFPQLTMDQLNDQQRPVAEKIMEISSVGLGGPYNPLLRSPVLAQRMLDLLEYLRWNSSVPLRLNEMAILIQGRLWRSQVEWYAHAPLALKAGLSEGVVADIKANRRPQNTSGMPGRVARTDFVRRASRIERRWAELFSPIATVADQAGHLGTAY